MTRNEELLEDNPHSGKRYKRKSLCLEAEALVVALGEVWSGCGALWMLSALLLGPVGFDAAAEEVDEGLDIEVITARLDQHASVATLQHVVGLRVDPEGLQRIVRIDLPRLRSTLLDSVVTHSLSGSSILSSE